jgi:hypothetical protein
MERWSTSCKRGRWGEPARFSLFWFLSLSVVALLASSTLDTVVRALSLPFLPSFP